jgi:xeroderma pigmentosum group C-complementing protein
MMPTIRGIVVHEHNADLLREAHVEFQSQLVENEYKERQREIYGKWKRLIKGVMTKERLEREYAND